MARRPPVPAGCGWRDERGAESVELALVLPLFLVVVLGSMQIAAIAMVRYEVKFIARETARWLAVHPDTTDGALLSLAQGQLMPPMTSSGIVSVTASPGCTALSGGHCSGRSSGTEVTVSMTYDASGQYFLPRDFFGFTWAPGHLSSQVSILVE